MSHGEPVAVAPPGLTDACAQRGGSFATRRSGRWFASDLKPALSTRRIGTCAAHRDSLPQDPLDGSSTAPAPHGAAKATIDLICPEWLLPRCRYHVPNLVVT